MCDLFGIDKKFLPEVIDSNGFFGETTFEGYFTRPVPIRGVLGDSHGALFGQGCLKPGTIKATYGTGSSVMMNIGEKPISSDNIVTSLAWGMDGKVNYVLEGNINYTGAVIKWLADDLGLITSPNEAGKVAAGAKNIDGLYLVPAFSGLGAPYWNGNARTLICGIDRGCGKAELVRAAEEAIAYQITEILNLMRSKSGIEVTTLKVDGGPTRDRFLMQFQADIADVKILVPEVEELSDTGAAYAAGIALGIYDKTSIFEHLITTQYHPVMSPDRREKLINGWYDAVRKSLSV
jgi:glycerol kinase